MWMCYDNQGTIFIVNGLIFHECIKHIKIDYHSVQDLLMRRHIVTPHVRWNDQLGDILIKLLIFASFQYLFFKLGRGVLDLYAPG